MLRPRGGHQLRETVLVMALFNHPGLLHTHFDEFAHLDLADRDLTALQAAMLESVAGEGDGEAVALRETLGAGRFAPMIARLDRQIGACGLASVMPSASVRDAEQVWLQAVTLHRRARTLHKDLKDAEAALALDPNEASLALVQNIQGQIGAVEGTEALIDGFGAGQVKRTL
jgi:DNA primase